MRSATLIDLSRAPRPAVALDVLTDCLQAAVENIERVARCDLIAAIVLCRQTGMTRDEAASILADVYAAPSDSAERRKS